MDRRFVPLAEFAQIMDITLAQARAMVKSGEMPAIQVGGRGQWRIELTKIDEYIANQYEVSEAERKAREAREEEKKRERHSGES